MSAPATDPGTEGAPAAGSNSDPTAQGSPSSGTGTAQPGGTVPSSEGSSNPSKLSENEQRGADDPHGESAKHWNRIANAKDQKLKEYAGLEVAMEKLGGAAGIMGHLERFSQLMANEQFASMANEFQRTGTFKLPAGYEAPEEEYLSEEEKKLQGLESKISGMEQTMLDRDAANARGALTKAFVSAIQGLHLTTDQQELLLPKLEAQVRSWTTSAAGVKALADLSNNENSVKVMVMGQLSETEQEEAIMRRRDARNAARTEERSAFATDARAEVQTGGQEHPAEGLAVVESIRGAYRELGLDPTKSLLNQ